MPEWGFLPWGGFRQWEHVSCRGLASPGWVPIDPDDTLALLHPLQDRTVQPLCWDGYLQVCRTLPVRPRPPRSPHTLPSPQVQNRAVPYLPHRWLLRLWYTVSLRAHPQRAEACPSTAQECTLPYLLCIWGLPLRYQMPLPACWGWFGVRWWRRRRANLATYVTVPRVEASWCPLSHLQRFWFLSLWHPLSVPTWASQFYQRRQLYTHILASADDQWGISFASLGHVFFTISTVLVPSICVGFAGVPWRFWSSHTTVSSSVSQQCFYLQQPTSEWPSAPPGPSAPAAERCQCGSQRCSG